MKQVISSLMILLIVFTVIISMDFHKTSSSGTVSNSTSVMIEDYEQNLIIGAFLRGACGRAAVFGVLTIASAGAGPAGIVTGGVAAGLGISELRKCVKGE